jgi:anti-anti-sigma factor
MHDPAHRARPLVAPGRSCPESRGHLPSLLPAGRAVVSYTSGGARIGVEILGELDLDSGTQLRGDLFEALARSSGGLELDLSRLEFCDCAGLSVLMELRRRADQQDKTVVVRACSPAVDRLLTLIGAQELFATPGPQSVGRAHPASVTVPSPTAGMSPGAVSPHRANLTGCREAAPS